jgi:hypothetical protein
LDVSIRKELLKFYIWSIGLCGVETGTLQKVDQKYVGSFGMRCWRRMAMTSWPYLFKTEELLHGVEGRDIVRTVIRNNTKWVCHILHRNCLLKHVIEGKNEGYK